jgi:hypothetical protein
VGYFDWEKDAVITTWPVNARRGGAGVPWSEKVFTPKASKLKSQTASKWNVTEEEGLQRKNNKWLCDSHD